MKQKILYTLGLTILGSAMYFSGGLKNLTTALIQQDFDYIVTLQTNEGDIKIKLYKEKTPKTAENFFELAKAQKYDGTIFHRVIKDFMIQGGDFENADGTGGTSIWENEFADEFAEGLSNVRGAVSMANRGPNTNGSQFFIVHKDSQFLDGRHSVFGHVIEGMDVVDKIATQKTNFMDAPLQEIKIKKAIVE